MSAGTIGVDLVGCWYAAAPEVLEMEEALKPNLPTGDVVEESRCMLREHEPVLLEYGGRRFAANASPARLGISLISKDGRLEKAFQLDRKIRRMFCQG
jgi:hypothetical protein